MLLKVVDKYLKSSIIACKVSQSETFKSDVYNLLHPIHYVTICIKVRGHTVVQLVEALYKLEGRMFNSQCGTGIFH
jgi:hypothetical protein